METTAARQGGIVVEQVGFSFIVHNPGMIRKATSLGRHHHTAVFPRAGWTWAGGIADMFGNGSSGKDEIVETVVFVEPRAFFISGETLRISFAALAKSFNGHVLHDEAMVTDVGVVGDHVLVQLHIPALGIAPAKISLAVVVNEHGR